MSIPLQSICQTVNLGFYDGIMQLESIYQLPAPIKLNVGGRQLNKLQVGGRHAMHRKLYNLDGGSVTNHIKLKQLYTA